MGGEGHMAAAINSLKNNRSLLKKRKDKKALSGNYSDVKLRDFPEATPENLKAIRTRIRKEERQARKRYLIAFFIISFALILLLYLIT
ncbi:potassium-transporting ATPase subunit KdpA [Cognatitamlana onchidii]|uniref:potassium-transporting ATPase subunit KdpA n=1 Tax=Cognatitamlana onchidii TaxID=2562860 RepID=UPI0010A5CBF9|nr:potassium-transporting ATPase subunit KdpA [Algibacter onchidii]